MGLESKNQLLITTGLADRTNFIEVLEPPDGDDRGLIATLIDLLVELCSIPETSTGAIDEKRNLSQN